MKKVLCSCCVACGFLSCSAMDKGILPEQTASCEKHVRFVGLENHNHNTAPMKKQRNSLAIQLPDDEELYSYDLEKKDITRLKEEALKEYKSSPDSSMQKLIKVFYGNSKLEEIYSTVEKKLKGVSFKKEVLAPIDASAKTLYEASCIKDHSVIQNILQMHTGSAYPCVYYFWQSTSKHIYIPKGHY
ncbi:hypothetical protein Barb4_04121 [Bacteroidales bacterium Barb4]|nr:hypothetical protein Barb4_04121 [Bacteroidales bacterium Barb4]